MKVQAGESAKLVGRRGYGLELASGVLHEGIKGGIDGGHQNLFLALEVEIDGAIGNTGAVSDVRDASDVEAFFGKN